MKKILFIFIIQLMAKNSNAQNSLPIKKISIFKNGTALVIKEGNLTLKKGVGNLPIPATALYGSYFLGSSKENPIHDLKFKNDTVKKNEKVVTLWQILAANVGKNVTLNFTPSNQIDKQISGKILEYNQQSNLVKLKSANGKISQLNADYIYQIDLEEEGNPYFMQDSVSRMIVFKTEKTTDNISLQEYYLQNNINWLPSYFLKLKDDKTARLEMKATVENFADEITDGEVELVVGAPQMSYSNKLDPMTYDYYESDAGNTAATAAYSFSNAMQTNAMYAKAADADGSNAFESNFSTEGEKNDDQYIYKIGKISLAKSGKGSFPIFANLLEYKDKYEGVINDISNFYATRNTNQQETFFDVYHSLEIKNTTPVPLTTAPIMMVNEKDQFLSQDMLKYTPVGAFTNVRISKAVDILMKNKEEEISRVDDEKKIGKNIYSKIVVKGTINVENYQAKELLLTVTKNLTGTILKADEQGKITKNKSSYISENPNSEIKWDIKLTPNQKKILTYEYEVLFQN